MIALGASQVLAQVGSSARARLCRLPPPFLWRRSACIRTTGPSISQGNQKLTALYLNRMRGHMLQIDYRQRTACSSGTCNGLNTADDPSHRDRSWQVTERCPREGEHQARRIL